jgi:ribonuclease P protein component
VTGVKNTIKSTDAISSLFKTAQRVTTRSFVALIEKRDEGCDSLGRVAFIAGKRLGNAPRRNRMKRLMREALRVVRGPWPGVDVVFVARENAATATVDDIVSDMERLARRLRKESRRETLVGEGEYRCG